MKTWICSIYGGGTPLYLVNADNEKRAWESIKETLSCYYPQNILKYSTGLIEFPESISNNEKIINIYDIYAPNGLLKIGSFEGLE